MENVDLYTLLNINKHATKEEIVIFNNLEKSI
jgi:DnaJ-class molecular chaperone